MRPDGQRAGLGGRAGMPAKRVEDYSYKILRPNAFDNQPTPCFTILNGVNLSHKQNIELEMFVFFTEKLPHEPLHYVTNFGQMACHLYMDPFHSIKSIASLGKPVCKKQMWSAVLQLQALDERSKSE